MPLVCKNVHVNHENPHPFFYSLQQVRQVVIESHPTVPLEEIMNQYDAWYGVWADADGIPTNTWANGTEGVPEYIKLGLGSMLENGEWPACAYCYSNQLFPIERKIWEGLPDYPDSVGPRRKKQDNPND